MPDDSGGRDATNVVDHQDINNKSKLPRIPSGIDAVALDPASSAVSSQPSSGSTTPSKSNLNNNYLKPPHQRPSSDTTSGFNSAYTSALNSPANSESGEDEICDADCLNPYAPAKKYYHSRTGRNFPRHGRAMSIQDSEELGRLKNFALLDIGKHEGDKAANELKVNGPKYTSTSLSRGRRFSAEGGFFNHHNRRFLIDVDKTINELLRQEDTNGDMQITIEDGGPKILYLGTASSEGFKKAGIRGTYMLSNLLQELTLAKEHGNKTIILDEARLNENPVDRLSRLISTEFWPALTRQIDETSISVAALDTKDRSDDPRPRIYIPYYDNLQFKYYNEVSEHMPELRLDVQRLPKDITAQYLLTINDKPGLLSLCLRKFPDPNKPGKFIYRGLPFVVPGGRFNEQYGWDSYMESLGLIVNNRVDLARNMVLNFCYEIKNYGKILNANRSYYLLRSQPPFLTDMALKVYEAIKSEDKALEFLRYAFSCAIKEYETVWMAEPRLDTVTGLSRYHPDGMGFPPETEPSHFDHLLEPYVEKYKIPKEEFIRKYNAGEIHEKALDIYLMHDRAVRESGHDTTCRFDNKCADLATVDLNTLLYKYETDIETVIRTKFDNHMVLSFDDPYEDNMQEDEYLAKELRVESSLKWNRAARRRKRLIDKYLWNAEKRMYFDFNTATHQQEDYVSATMFWALYAQCASPLQAANVVENALPLLEQYGGLASCSKDSVRKVSLDAPNRQWDYPFGWAPQQMLAWKGLSNYGYKQETQRIVYRWLFMMTKAFVDFNGIVVEKYNVTKLSDPHRVDAEYGNQGANFKGRAKEGFGWVNASYVVGLTYLSTYARRALGTLTPPEAFFQAEESESD